MNQPQPSNPENQNLLCLQEIQEFIAGHEQEVIHRFHNVTSLYNQFQQHGTPTSLQRIYQNIYAKHKQHDGSAHFFYLAAIEHLHHQTHQLNQPLSIVLPFVSHSPEVTLHIKNFNRRLQSILA